MKNAVNSILIAHVNYEFKGGWDKNFGHFETKKSFEHQKFLCIMFKNFGCVIILRLIFVFFSFALQGPVNVVKWKTRGLVGCAQNEKTKKKLGWKRTEKLKNVEANVVVEFLCEIAISSQKG
jgi:hypothetical protein